MKKVYLLFFFSLIYCSKIDQNHLKPVSVKEFKEFVNATGYQTDAEKYGWSIVQINVFDFEIVDGANWLKPDGENPSIDSLPVTQVSYKDAVEYCKWAGVSLPTYEQYWVLVSNDKRVIVSDNKYPISPVEKVNVVGNVWDITETINSDKVRLAGGSLFCSRDTCHGTQKDRELYVDKETGNIHIGFSVLTQ
ncbi:MAG: SUMF1/EgtB/PvdO family nonheme iron enzyme [Bacteroidota bacterium]|nr:SUMF1/EgtB/PvdO family nonheme iron enzyme [Bacteroidota bacterium]